MKNLNINIVETLELSITKRTWCSKEDRDRYWDPPTSDETDSSGNPPIMQRPTDYSIMQRPISIDDFMQRPMGDPFDTLRENIAENPLVTFGEKEDEIFSFNMIEQKVRCI